MQVLIATATLAWGVNFPAHLVVVKGTEYYDGKSKRYVDMPITDVLQMMGRAGRPQYDQEGVAVVLVCIIFISTRTCFVFGNYEIFYSACRIIVTIIILMMQITLIVG